MFYYIGRMAFCLGFLAIASQGGENKDQEAVENKKVQDVVSAIENMVKNKNQNKQEITKTQKENEELARKKEEIEKKIKELDRDFKKQITELKTQWDQISHKELKLHNPQNDGYNSDKSVKHFNKKFEELSNKKKELDKLEAETKEELIIKAEAIKNQEKKGPTNTLIDAFASLKDSACKDIALIKPKVDFSQQNKWRLNVKDGSANCSSDINYNIKSKKIEPDQVSNRRAKVEGPNKFVSYAQCNAETRQPKKQETQKKLEACLEALATTLEKK